MTDKKQAKKQGMDLGKVLLWSTVLVESPRWSGAMLAADVGTVPDWLSVALNVLNTVSGAFMGVIVVVATAYLLDAVRVTKPTIAVRRKNETVDRPNFRFVGLMIFSAGLLALTPFVLAPYIVSRMTGETIATVLTDPFWRYAWAITVVVAPAFVIGGVAFAQPGLVKVSESDPKVAGPVSEEKPKAKKEEPKKAETFGKWKTWRSVPQDERLVIAGMTDVRQVMEAYGVIERTAYNWMENARELLKADLASAGEELSSSVNSDQSGG